ncbi:MAG TPA: hypothetical protein VKZ18_19650 [Polyangia bacterium]|nr:hypothetical protein [Polyangia bacterium]
MTNTKTLGFLSAITAFAALTPACALRPPVENSGAATADNGVAVAVLRQSCSETVETELPGVPLVETKLEVEVRNVAPPPLVVHRGEFHLRGADGRAIPTTSWQADEPISVEAGQTRTFELRFMSRGGLSCTKPMQLEAAAGITKGDAPVRIGAVTFVPSHV